MKKLLFTLVFGLLTCSCVFGQSNADIVKALRDRAIQENSNKYLTVKGIELKPGLKMNEVLQKMQAKGMAKTDIFKIAKEQFGILDLTGDFAGRSNCNIKVVPISKDKDVVGAISISFPNSETFKSLKDLYDRLKFDLSQKYYIFESEEKFYNDYVNNSTSDYLKRSAIENDEASFETRFHLSDTENSLYLGYVVLRIAHLNVDYHTSCFVMLSYCTPYNVEEQFTTIEDDL